MAHPSTLSQQAVDVVGAERGLGSDEKIFIFFLLIFGSLVCILFRLKVRKWTLPEKSIAYKARSVHTESYFLLLFGLFT